MKNKSDVGTNMERTDLILKLNHSDFSGKLPKGCAIPQKIFALIGKFDKYFLLKTLNGTSLKIFKHYKPNLALAKFPKFSNNQDRADFWLIK